MNIKLILILIMVSFTMIGQTSCSSSSKQNPDLSTTRDSAIFTIIPFKDYPSIFENSQQAFLSESDFPIIENMLIKCLEEYNLEQEKINVDTNLKSTAFNADNKNYIIDLKSYKRQYIVVTNEKEEKEVWINCFCGESDHNWRKELIMVDDGGNCFFNVKVNLATRVYYSLMVNGDA